MKTDIRQIKKQTSKTFREFEKYFNQIVRVGRKENRQSEDILKFLTPAKLRSHIQRKKSLILRYGNKESQTIVLYKDFVAGKFDTKNIGYIEFEIDDLQMFLKTMDKAGKAVKKGAGIQYDQLLGLAEKQRIHRANREIRTALLYRVKGDTLHFQVTASPQSKRRFHQTKIRLEDWHDNMLDPRVTDYKKLVQKIISGKVSVDCDCEDLQYRHRYWLTFMGGLIKPLEKDFPKIRNPAMDAGVICKHMIKTLSALKTPTIINFLAKELKKQAEAGGLGSTRERIVTKKDLEKLLKAFDKEAKRVSISETKKAYQKFKKAKKNFRKKKKGETVKIQELEQQRDKLREQTQRQRKQLETQRQEIDNAKLLQDLAGFIPVSIYRDGLSKDDAVAEFAKKNNMSVQDIQEIGGEILNQYP